VTGDQGPALQVLSHGAGVQSTALLILAARGVFGRLDAAVFADTGWEPAATYAHLDRLGREVAAPAGIPLIRVTAGHIRAAALDPAHRFASMPLYVLGPDGSAGMARRQCTREYEIDPVKRQLRAMLGAPPRPDGVPGRVPRGRYAVQWVGISADEAHRARTSHRGVAYARPRWPLLERGLSRADCVEVNASAGFVDVPKSACVGCPFHTNGQWREMRDHSPAEWADAVAFDRSIRAGSARANALGRPLLGQAYLHRSRVPLDVAPIDHVTAADRAARQTDALDLLSAEAMRGAMTGDPATIRGCGPHTYSAPARVA
jgi:hypothetical protein